MSIYPVIAVQNESTAASDEDVIAAASAVAHQVHYHFRPHWHTYASVVYVPKGSQAPTGAWLCHVLDDSDQAGALGYHDVAAGEVPELLVFARTDKEYGLSLSVTLSHEVLETLADPATSLAAQVTNEQFYAVEVGDPVEADQLGYSISGVLVSDFILPAWFDNLAEGPYDYQGHLDEPLELAPGGYASIYTSGEGWGMEQMKAGELVPVPLPTDDPRFRDRGHAQTATGYAHRSA